MLCTVYSVHVSNCLTVFAHNGSNSADYVHCVKVMTALTVEGVLAISGFQDTKMYVKKSHFLNPEYYLQLLQMTLLVFL